MGFVCTVTQRRVAAQIDTAVKRRHREADFDSAPQLDALGLNPEAMALARERAEIAQSALAELLPRDREILERFYLKEQTQEQICAEMNLTETQFRRGKSRAKERFGAIGQKKLSPFRHMASLISRH
jgi:RNA polymerase sigma factor (sigma-70 family)